MHRLALLLPAKYRQAKYQAKVQPADLQILEDLSTIDYKLIRKTNTNVIYNVSITFANVVFKHLSVGWQYIMIICNLYMVAKP